MGMARTIRGDYPAIKGDQAIWWIMNDLNQGHMESQADPLGIELHGMAYAYNSNNTAVNNTIFMEYTIINRSAREL